VKDSLMPQKNMTIWIAVSGLLAAITVLAPWIVVFNGPLSTKPEDWAAFGSYIGGTIQPILMALTIVAMLATIWQQQRQIRHMVNDSIQRDILETIKMLEADFVAELEHINFDVQVGANTMRFSGLEMVSSVSFVLSFRNYMVNAEDLLKHAEKSGSVSQIDPLLLACERFGFAAGKLDQLRHYVESYEAISQSNQLTIYYAKKYKIAFDRFIARGFLQDRIHARTSPDSAAIS
jgi:uncharacterized membrane protein